MKALNAEKRNGFDFEKVAEELLMLELRLIVLPKILVTSIISSLSSSFGLSISFSDQRLQIDRACEKYSFFGSSLFSDNNPIHARHRARRTFLEASNPSSLPNASD